MRYVSPAGVELPLEGLVRVVGAPGSGKTMLIKDMADCLLHGNTGKHRFMDGAEEIDPSTDGGKVILGLPLDLDGGYEYFMGLGEDRRHFVNETAVSVFRESLGMKKHRGRTLDMVREIVTIPDTLSETVALICGGIPETSRRRKVDIVAGDLERRSDILMNRVAEIKKLMSRPVFGGDLDKQQEEATGRLDRATFEIKRLEEQARVEKVRPIYEEIDNWRLSRAQATQALGLIRQERERQKVVGDGDDRVLDYTQTSVAMTKLAGDLRHWLQKNKVEGGTIIPELTAAWKFITFEDELRFTKLSHHEDGLLGTLIRAALAMDVMFPWLVLDGVYDHDGRLGRYLDKIKDRFRGIIWLTCHADSSPDPTISHWRRVGL